MVRNDLPVHDQIVQACHACYESSLKYGTPDTYLVLLQVRDQNELIQWSKICEDNDIQYHMFHEPDHAEEVGEFPMGFTALCTEPLFGKKRESFRNCELWSHTISQ